ncbi:MAG TPA: conjugal transfer protein TraJ [Acetobacteraceae bacterium]|nr:conjugal transfer protein TraJ [Acetobacteraceae bacterium]
MKEREPRDRQRHLKVVVSASERARIEERAKAAGMSVSAYLRTAGLGHPIKSVLDHAAVTDLCKVNGDQGRLGGLLKLWLVDRPGRGASEAEVRRLLDRIGDLQGRLAEVVGRV